MPRRNPATGSQAAQPASQLGTAHQLCLIFTLAGASYPSSTQKRKSEHFRTKPVIVAKSGQRLPETGLELTEPSCPPELVHVAQLPKLAWDQPPRGIFDRKRWFLQNPDSGCRGPGLSSPRPRQARLPPPCSAPPSCQGFHSFCRPHAGLPEAAELAHVAELPKPVEAWLLLPQAGCPSSPRPAHRIFWQRTHFLKKSAYVSRGRAAVAGSPA